MYELVIGPKETTWEIRQKIALALRAFKGGEKDFSLVAEKGSIERLMQILGQFLRCAGDRVQEGVSYKLFELPPPGVVKILCGPIGGGLDFVGIDVHIEMDVSTPFGEKLSEVHQQ
jgi:hypothetical protein